MWCICERKTYGTAVHVDRVYSYLDVYGVEHYPHLYTDRESAARVLAEIPARPLDGITYFIAPLPTYDYIAVSDTTDIILRFGGSVRIPVKRAASECWDTEADARAAVAADGYYVAE